MGDLIQLRASALPMAFRCPGSVRPSKITIHETSEAAELGTAAHEALRALAETGSVDWDALPALCERHEVPQDDVRMLCAMATKLWPSLRESFPQALTEQEFSAEIAPGVTLTGHVDLLSITGSVARAGDWKSGRKDSDYSQQMKGYAALLLLEDQTLTEATVTVIWLRDGEIENYTMTRDGLRTWLAQLRSEVIDWAGAYEPGAHCTFCPRSHECEARNAMVRRDVAALSDRTLVARAECELELMAPEQVVELLAKADLVADYADRVRGAIKKHVQTHGDIVAGGVRLTIETERQRQLAPAAAWPVLEAAGFEDKDFARVMDLRISRVEKVVAEKAGKGGGAAAIRQLKKDLEEAGAVGHKEVQKLTRKRA